MSLSPIHL